MAGGTTTKVSPWAEQQPYLERGFERAETLYGMNPAGTPYYGGPTVAGFDPAQEAAQGAMLGYATGPRPGIMQAGTETAMMRGLQGDGGVNFQAEPFSRMMAAAGSEARRNLLHNELPSIREAMVGTATQPVQQGGGTRGDLLQQQALADANEQIYNRMADIYGDAYFKAEAAVPDYIKMSQQVQQTPFGMYDRMGEVGADRRAMTQEGINRAMQKYGWESAGPQRALQNYLASVTGDYGSVTTQQRQPNLLGAIGSAVLPGLLTG